jgi:hypothetical protein
MIKIFVAEAHSRGFTPRPCQGLRLQALTLRSLEKVSLHEILYPAKTAI